MTLFPNIKSKKFVKGVVENGGHSVFYRYLNRSARETVVIVHGGPGSGISDMHPRFFDHARYNVIQFDQRCCGDSVGALETVSVEGVASDIIAICDALSIDRVRLFGISWGATIALAAAGLYPHRFSAVDIVSPLVATSSVIRWIYEPNGAAVDSSLEGAYAEIFSRYSSVNDLVERVLDARCERAVLAQIQWESVLSGMPVPEEFHQKMQHRATMAAHSFFRDPLLQGEGLEQAMYAIPSELAVRVIRSDDDASCPRWFNDMLASCINHVSMTETSGCGHSSQNPEWHPHLLKFINEE